MTMLLSERIPLWVCDGRRVRSAEKDPPRVSGQGGRRRVGGGRRFILKSIQRVLPLSPAYMHVRGGEVIVLDGAAHGEEVDLWRPGKLDVGVIDVLADQVDPSAREADLVRRTWKRGTAAHHQKKTGGGGGGERERKTPPGK